MNPLDPQVQENKEVNPDNPGERLIALDPIVKILETIIFSSYVLGSIPVSAFVVAPSGAGKSKTIIQYKGTNGCHLTNDVTSMGLQELLKNDNDGKLRTIIVPDFNLVLSHRTSTLQLTIANLLSVMSEGTVRIDDGRETKEVKHDPVGVITAMTFDMYKRQAIRWMALGLTRRFLPLYYDYGLSTRLKIQDSIAKGHTTALQLESKTLPVPRHEKEIHIPSHFAKAIQELSSELAFNLGKVPLPKPRDKNRARAGQKFADVGKQLEFSPHVTLRTLAKASALKRDSWEIEQVDLDFLLEVMRYTRIDRPGEL